MPTFLDETLTEKHHAPFPISISQRRQLHPTTGGTIYSNLIVDLPQFFSLTKIKKNSDYPFQRAPDQC